MIPLAAFAEERAEGLTLIAYVLSPDGRECITASATELPGHSDPNSLGHEVAARLQALGAERLLRPIR